MLVTFIVLKGKNYYLAPAYPFLFAAGAIAFERITAAPRLHFTRFPFTLFPRFLRYTCLAVVIRAGAALAPLSAPILSPEVYIRYHKVLGIEPSKTENQETGPLPQHFADEFGWEDMTRAVATIY